jgi:phage terminase small subunit
MATKKLTIADIPGRPKAPRELPRPGAELWRSIVAAYPVEHFTGANLALLESLCQSHCLIRELDKAIAKEDLFCEGRPHPAIAMRQNERKSFMSLATKLRLPISATMRAEAAAARPDAKNALRKPWEAA